MTMLPARRTILFAILGTAMAAAAPAWAQAQPVTPTTRAAAWALGSNLSLAALLHGQGAKQDLVDRTTGRAEAIAKALGFERLPPLPPKAASNAATQAEIIQYLIKGDGAQLGVTLGKRYDQAHTVLFELAVKSNLLILLYAPGNDSGLGELVENRSRRLGLPPETWLPLVEAVKAKKSHDDVKDAVFAMHAAVMKQLAGPK